MFCECCGRETNILIEIGAISPKVSTTGKCCTSCCTFILMSLEDTREFEPKRRTELIPVDENKVFYDEIGEPVDAREIRFGMKDAGSVVHYFRIDRVPMIPEMAAYEIYPEKGSKSSNSERTEYSFRTFGTRKSDQELMAELLVKIETGLLNPVIEQSRTLQYMSLKERGYAQIESKDGEVFFWVDGKRYSAQKFADLLGTYEGFHLTWQIRDACRPLPNRNTYYLPVEITDESLQEELEILIRTLVGESNYISYKDVPAFHIGFDPIYDKLELFCNSNRPGVGKIAGMKLIHRLENVETDDETFPEYEIAMIRDLIGEY